MGKIRTFSTHVKWTQQEIKLVKHHYEHGNWVSLMKSLPGRSASQIQNKGHWLGLKRRKIFMTPEQILASKRNAMASKRKRFPEQQRAYQRKMWLKNKDRINKQRLERYTRRFFWARGIRFKGNGEKNAKLLASLWKSQKGKCALTGRPLDRTSQVDHIISRARGGHSGEGNLRWLCKEANLARRELSDAEFIALCQDVVRNAASNRDETVTGTL